jgi:hypothetical protein
MPRSCAILCDSTGLAPCADQDGEGLVIPCFAGLDAA